MYFYAPPCISLNLKLMHQPVYHSTLTLNYRLLLTYTNTMQQK